MGRWLNPDSIKIYARMGIEEYGHWVDKLMTVRHIDAARTRHYQLAGYRSYTDLADVLGPWYRSMDMQLERNNEPEADPFDENAAPPNNAPSPPLGKGTKLSVYWTDMEQWFNAQWSEAARHPHTVRCCACGLLAHRQAAVVLALPRARRRALPLATDGLPLTLQSPRRPAASSASCAPLTHLGTRPVEALGT